MATPDHSPNPPGRILDHDTGIGEADAEMVEERAVELAEIDGLDADQVNEGHRTQARRELSGAADPNEANDNEGPEADLIAADDVPGESGVPVAPATNAAQYGDEPTIGESLYAEGIDEADHDRMLESRQQEREDEL